MKIYKSKYGWSTTAHSKTQEGEKIECYLDAQFQKGSEPMGEEIEGKLVFKGDDGIERDCFFTSYRKKDGSVHPKLFVMGKSKPTVVATSPIVGQTQTTLSGNGRDLTGHYDNNVTIDESELPFY